MKKQTKADVEGKPPGWYEPNKRPQIGGLMRQWQTDAAAQLEDDELAPSLFLPGHSPLTGCDLI